MYSNLSIGQKVIIQRPAVWRSISTATRTQGVVREIHSDRIDVAETLINCVTGQEYSRVMTIHFDVPDSQRINVEPIA